MSGTPGARATNAVGYPSGQREQTVNLPAHAFEGSNPSPTIREGRTEKRNQSEPAKRDNKSIAGVAQLVERKPSKLDVAGSSPVSRSGERLEAGETRAAMHDRRLDEEQRETNDVRSC